MLFSKFLPLQPCYYIDGYWTYSVNDIWVGLQQSYQDMAKNLKDKFDITIRKINSLGISAMMHGIS